MQGPATWSGEPTHYGTWGAPPCAAENFRRFPEAAIDLEHIDTLLKKLIALNYRRREVLHLLRASKTNGKTVGRFSANSVQ